LILLGAQKEKALRVTATNPDNKTDRRSKT